MQKICILKKKKLQINILQDYQENTSLLVKHDFTI